MVVHRMLKNGMKFIKGFWNFDWETCAKADLTEKLEFQKILKKKRFDVFSISLRWRRVVHLSQQSRYKSFSNDFFGGMITLSENFMGTKSLGIF